MTTIICTLSQLLSSNGEFPWRLLAAILATHRATCPACRRDAQGAAMLREELHILRSNAVADGTAVRAAMRRMAAIEADSLAIRVARRRNGWWLGAGALGIASLLLAATLLRSGPIPTTGATNTIAMRLTPKTMTKGTGIARERSEGQVERSGMAKSIVSHIHSRVVVHPLRNDTPSSTDIVTPDKPEPLSKPRHSTTDAVSSVNAVEDDLAYINVESGGGRWTSLAPSDVSRLEAELMASVQGGDDFVEVPFPRLAAVNGEKIAASALAHWRQERQIVDARLQRKVSLAIRGMAFTDLCRKLTDETGIAFSAGRDVAEDKVTLFCKNRPLRDILRQITVLFNFTWDRSGVEGEFAYKLKQPLRSELLEEELRNRDRDEALLALDREMDAFRELLALSPEEASQRAASASGEEKKRLEALAGNGWGPAQLYGRMSSADLTALRDGQRFAFGTLPIGPMMPLPPELERNILASQPDVYVIRETNGDPRIARAGEDDVQQGVPAAQFGTAHAQAALWIDRSEAGEFRLMASSGVAVERMGGSMSDDENITLATGISPSRRDPKNEEANAAQATDPEMKRQVSIVPKIACRLTPGIYAPKTGPQSGEPSPMTTTGDLLEAIHLATGLDIIGDYYTCLYPAGSLTAREVTLFVALNRVTDAARLRWKREGGWLGFRTLGFFNERPKEIPNALLGKWAESRKQNGALTIEDFMEIAALRDVQTDSQVIADAMRGLYSLEEWDLARRGLRPHWKLLASLTPQRRRAAVSAQGVAFNDLTPNEQQAFFQAIALVDVGPQLDVLPGAAFRIEYRNEAKEAKSDSPKPVTLQMLYTLGGPFAGKRQVVVGYDHIYRRELP